MARPSPQIPLQPPAPDALLWLTSFPRGGSGPAFLLSPCPYDSEQPRVPHTPGREGLRFQVVEGHYGTPGSRAFSPAPSLLLRPVLVPRCSPIPFPLQRGAHLLPARGALRSHIIMHIRYKQSCLIILRHISDRVINKHCKINEEKCDLQFPLIGKALAVPRHKVILLSRRRGRDADEGCCPMRAPAPPRPSPTLTPAFSHPTWKAGTVGGRAGTASGLVTWPSPLWLELQRDCHLTPGAACSALGTRGNRLEPEPPTRLRPPSLGLGAQEYRPPGCLRPPPSPLPPLSCLPFKAFCLSAIYSEGSAASCYF